MVSSHDRHFGLLTMKILFVTHMLADRNFHPYGICALAGVLKVRGHSCHLSDAGNPRGVLKKVETLRPDIVAYSCATAWYPALRLLNARLKSRHSFQAVFGGPHATGVPEIIEDAGVDAVGIGECDLAFADFVDRLEAGAGADRTPGFWTKSEAGIRRNELADLVGDLDTLPFPDHGLCVREGYLAETGVAVFLGSRGCKHACPYCINSLYRRLYGPNYRRRSPESLVEEIVRARMGIPIQYIVFMDDYFSTESDWLPRFCELYGQRVRIPFWINIRPDVLDESNVRLMRSAGLHAAAIGIEAGDRSIRQEKLGRNISLEQVEHAVHLLKASGVVVHSLNVLGLPGSTLDTDIETVNLNRRLRIDYATFSLFQAFPGTPMGDQVRESGAGAALMLHNNIFSPTFKKPPLPGVAEHTELLPVLWPLAYFGAASEWVNRRMTMLMRLPLRWLYVLLFKGLDGYMKKTRVYPHKASLRMTIRIILSFFKE